MQNELLLACWFDSRTNQYRSCWGDENSQDELLDAVRSVDFIVAQNAKFELAWLDRCGVDLHDILVFDTFLAEWILLGNLKDPKDLSSLAKRRGIRGKVDSVSWLIKNGVDPQNIPKPWLEEYCLEDVRTTLEVYLVQREELASRDQLHLQLARCMLTPVLVDMESNGIHLDHKKVMEEYRAVSNELADVELELAEYGDLNWRSRQQVAELLYDELQFAEVRDRDGPVRTASGQRGTSIDIISKLRGDTPKQRRFLELFKKQANLQAKRSKTLEFFRGICEEYDCKFNGSYNQGITATHRLSSSGRKYSFTTLPKPLGVQLQNMPREYKGLVTASNPGWLIVEADQAQLEFRGAAALTSDPVAVQEIIDEVDVHSVTREFFRSQGEFKGLDDKEARQQAKPQTFKPTYGGTGNTKAEKAYCKFFRDKYNVMYKVQYNWVMQVVATGKLRTPYGMEFFWPNEKVNAYGKATNQNAIFNYPIQGVSTGEIVPISLICLWHRLRGRKVRFILTIHDSVILEVHPDEDMEWIKEQIGLAFTRDVFNVLKKLYKFELKVPLACEIKIGTHWGKGEETKITYNPLDMQDADVG